MKKKILCFIFAFIFMFPLAFMLGGCFGENPPADPPPTEQGGEEGGEEGSGEQEQPLTVQDIITALEQVERNNFTATLNYEYTEKQYEVTDNLPSGGITKGESSPTIFVQLDGEDGYLNSPSMTGWVIDNQRYEVDDGELDLFLSNKVFRDDYTEIINVLKLFSNQEVFSSFVSVATMINNNCITIQEKTNETVVSINLYLAESLSKLAQIINNNKANSIYTLINALLAETSGNAEYDIMDLVDEFEASFTNDTTLTDLLDFISQKSGFAINTLFDKLCSVNNIYGNTSDRESDYIDSLRNYNFGYGNIGGSINYYNRQDKTLSDSQDFVDISKFKDIKLVDFVGTTDTTKTKKEHIFDFIKSYLGAEDLTLESIIQESVSHDDEYDYYMQLIEDFAGSNFNNADLNAVFTFDKNYNFTNISIEGLFDVSSIDDTTKDGYGLKYTFGLELNFSNIGTTKVSIDTTYNIRDIYIDLYITSLEIANLSGKLTKQINLSSVKIPSFSIIGYKQEGSGFSEDPTTFLTYSANTKLLMVESSFLLDALSINNVNLVSYNYYNNDGEYYGARVNIFVVA